MKTEVVIGILLSDKGGFYRLKNHRFFNREFVPCGDKYRRLRERHGY